MNTSINTTPEASKTLLISDRKLEANRANAQLSTGPGSEAGKASSSRNHLIHGLAGAFCLLPGEDADAYSRLLSSLTDEHEPSTATESLLVNDMARHYWLYQRALRLQEDCFAGGITDGAAQNRLSLFLRYATNHERSFRRSLSDLQKLRKERLQRRRGFESQARAQAVESRREAQEQRRARVAEREEEEYQKIKNKPKDEFDIINDYFREMNLRELTEVLAEEDDEEEEGGGILPKRKPRKKAA